ncbi:MAG: hypothetical protein K2K32_04160, partial [Muribaculaceae bacterium]|nr:hypothetical protein [Muribaculaceae bacterium]
ADVRWSYAKVRAFETPHNTNLTGNCALQWYVGKFQLSSGINLASNTLNRYSLTRIKSPFNYSFTVSYSHRNLIASVSTCSPFGKRRIESSVSSPFYSIESSILSRQNYKYGSFSLSYLFEFGKKTEYTKPEIDRDPYSSMLRES